MRALWLGVAHAVGAVFRGIGQGAKNLDPAHRKDGVALLLLGICLIVARAPGPTSRPRRRPRRDPGHRRLRPARPAGPDPARRHRRTSDPAPGETRGQRPDRDRPVRARGGRPGAGAHRLRLTGAGRRHARDKGRRRPHRLGRGDPAVVHHDGRPGRAAARAAHRLRAAGRHGHPGQRRPAAAAAARRTPGPPPRHGGRGVPGRRRPVRRTVARGAARPVPQARGTGRRAVRPRRGRAGGARPASHQAPAVRRAAADMDRQPDAVDVAAAAAAALDGAVLHGMPPSPLVADLTQGVGTGSGSRRRRPRHRSRRHVRSREAQEGRHRGRSRASRTSPRRRPRRSGSFRRVPSSSSSPETSPTRCRPSTCSRGAAPARRAAPPTTP